MKPINILVTTFGASQLTYHITVELNNLSNKNEYSPIVFYENLEQNLMICNFAIMQIAECWAQSGPCVATCLSTASKLIRFPTASPKLFYIWDLEWIRGQKRNYQQIAPIYRNPELTLIARSKEHANLIKTSFNVEVPYIVQQFNIEKFVEICYGKCKKRTRRLQLA